MGGERDEGEDKHEPYGWLHIAGAVFVFAIVLNALLDGASESEGVRLYSSLGLAVTIATAIIIDGLRRRNRRPE